MRSLALVIIAMMLLANQAAATESLAPSEKPDKGWFWYENPKDEEAQLEKKKTAPAAASKKADKEKKPMSAAWLREMLPKLQERAIDNPTKENLAAYFYATRVWLDKSQRFSEEGQKFIYSEPMLDENNRVPLAAFGKDEFMGKEFNSKEIALKHLAQKVGGLFVFFDSKCDFCKAQVKILNQMQTTYGFNIKYISMDGKGLPGIKDFVPDNGHAKMLDLKVFPTIVFAVPPSTYLVVSQGMMAKDQLGQRILTAASSNKLLPADMDKEVNPWDRGVLTVDDMQDGASDNPDEFVKYVKEKLKDRY